MEEAPFLTIMILAIKLLPNTHGVLRLPTSYKIWEIVDIGLDIWMVRGGYFGGNKVFLPAIGNRGKNNVNYWPETGYYRSSTGASGKRCYYLEFNQSYAVKNNYYWYWDGFPIRCVKR